MAYGAGKRKRFSQGGTKRYAKRRMFRVRSAFRGRPRMSVSRLVPWAKPELKTFDVTLSAQEVSTTGLFSEMCLPILGSDFNARVGRKIQMKSFYIRYHCGIKAAFTLGTITTTATQELRLIVFIDKQPNGAAPAVTDLLVAATPTSQLNMNNRDRFKVLRDVTHVFDPYTLLTASASPAWNRTAECGEIYKKINLECIFNATNGGTIADVNSGALYTFWIGSVGTGNNSGSVTQTSRVRYIDF